MAEHIPVLLNEVIVGLNINPAGIYLDATFGRGGHSKAILQQLNAEGKLIAIDRDPSAVASAKALADPRLHIFHAPFSELTTIAQTENVVGQVDGILFDLGVSSPQLDEEERGFSFTKEGPLDMRMDTSRGQTAAQWLAQVDEPSLSQVLFEYGEERFARRIAKAIITAREIAAITTTRQLAEIVAKANPKWEPHKHPATRSFQALRIAINDEFGELKTALQHSVEILKSGGRLAVISFHSLEDRLVKQFMQAQHQVQNVPRNLPLTKQQLKNSAPHLQVIGRAQKANGTEVSSNPRSRSAILRIAEKN